MKKFILFSTIIGFLLIFFSLRIFAQENSSLEKRNQEDLDKIQELKQKVAEKVAQLKKGALKVYSGKIKKIENENIILIDNDQELNIKITNQTLFTWINTDGKKLTLTLKDFTEEDRIFAWGPVDENTGVMTANNISGRIPPEIFNCQAKEKSSLSLNETLNCQTTDEEISLRITGKTNIFVVNEKERLNEVKNMEIPPLSKLILRGVRKEAKSKNVTAQTIIVLYLPSPSGITQ